MLDLNFSPSRRLAIVLAVAHALSVATLWLMQPPLWTARAGTLLIGISLVFYTRRNALLLAAASVVALRLSADGEVELTQRDGRRVSGRVLPGSFVHPYATSLEFRAEGARFRRALLIAPDHPSPEQFRQLRVWLKWRTPRKGDNHNP